VGGLGEDLVGHLVLVPGGVLLLPGPGTHSQSGFCGFVPRGGPVSGPSSYKHAAVKRLMRWRTLKCEAVPKRARI